MNRIRYYLEWLALRHYMSRIRRGDISQAWARTRRNARLATWIARREWSWAIRNLQLVFGPQLDQKSASRLATISFEQFFGSCMEGLRQDEIQIKISNADRDRVRAAYKEGRGVILCSVHLGSWEPSIRSLIQDGYPHAIVYKKALNPLSDREFQAIRASYGSEWIEVEDPTRILDALRQGKILALMTDLSDQ